MLVVLYGKLRNALVMCKQGIESWYGIWESKYKGVYSYWKTEDNEKYEFVKEVLWQEDGKFVGLDHEIPLGENGKALGK